MPLPWQFLYFRPLPQGHGSLRPTRLSTLTGVLAFCSPLVERLSCCVRIWLMSVRRGACAWRGAETSSLSKAVVTDMLRGRLGYDGIVITDSMQMEAAIQACENSEQAVKAIEAGADLVLMPEDFDAAYEGLIEAVSQGRVTEKRLNQSVRRIIKVKLHMPA